MKNQWTAWIAAGALLLAALPASAQAPRKDIIWARSTAGQAITLDGNLNEGAWVKAESLHVQWATNAGIPGSGWKIEGGISPVNPTFATLKFLVVGNQLYMGAVVRDKSVGGSKDFNRFDGFLMALKDHLSTEAPKPPAEHFYAWWYPTLTDPQPAGQSPTFIGKWATWPPGTPRDSTQVANWDARTVVHGTSNTDTVDDVDWTTEMRFNLTALGYTVNNGQGDVVEFNISVYDADWFWPYDAGRFSSNRVWWQGPWGNSAVYNEVRIHAKSDVTINSGALPAIGPELRIPNAGAEAAPTINGTLSESVWAKAPSFDMRYGDDNLRKDYVAIGPHRAGQYQPPVNGGQAFILDPGDATVKYFFKGNFLYLGFDVRDQVVQYHPFFDRWDGFLVLLNDVSQIGPDNQMLGRRISFQVGPTGQAEPQDYLPTLIAEGGASVALALKAGTTVDTLGLSPDTGYTAELAIDLTHLGYPNGLGDGTLFLGVNMADGDSFTPFTDSYGSRTWWFREYESTCCPVWAYLDPGFTVSDVNDEGDVRGGLTLVRNFPNPALATTIEYALTETSNVTFEVFDPSGRLIERRNLGTQGAGTRTLAFEGGGAAAGTYFYRLRLIDPATGASRSVLNGRINLVR